VADSAKILDDCHVGDSIAVNGACLTVTEFDEIANGGWFKVWLANETLQRTDLGACLTLVLFSHFEGGHVLQENAKPGINSTSSEL
jgi:hypothetical protein